MYIFLYASAYKAAHHRKINHLHLIRMHDESQTYCLERQIAEEGLEIRHPPEHYNFDVKGPV